jgi:hypothetical protein
MALEEEYRRNARIREETPIHWRIEDTDRTGEGVIRDISVSGVLLEVSTFFTPDKSAVFVLEPMKSEDELIIPDRARLVWSKMMKMEAGKYLCGLEFVKPSDSTVAKIAQHIENWFAHIAEGANVNILDNYFHGKNRR